MKKISIIIFILINHHIHAQDHTEITNEFKITGKVKNEKTITIADLEQYKTVELKDVNISCSPKKEDKAKQVKGVLLKDILDSVSFQYENRGMLNQYYFLFIASDGYKMVFSFNEIYNSQTGNNLYIVTEKEGKDIREMENRILVLVTTDIKAGRRNMKWLSKIVVSSAE